MTKPISQSAKSSAAEFDDFYSRPLYSFVAPELVSDAHRLAISAVCRRPELRPLLVDAKFEIEDTGDTPFNVDPIGRIKINPAILVDPPGACFNFYHMLELQTLFRQLPNAASPTARIAVAIGAFHSATHYFESLIDFEQQAAWTNIEPWAKTAINEIRALGETSNGLIESLKVIANACSSLLPLQGDASLGNDCSINQVDAAIAVAATMSPLLYPTARLLTTGGDNRLVLDDHSGLNAYGCSPRPRPWAITFSSCTASSISDPAFQEADWLRQRLLPYAQSAQLEQQSAVEHEQIRRDIHQLLEFDSVPGTEIMLASSGTDAEIHALHFAMSEPTNRIRNIVISSTEIGSGTVHAAGGRHFDDTAPLGAAVAKGSAIEGFPCDQVEVSIVELRDEDGRLRTMDELDAATVILVEDALAQGQRVLIHLLDCSKTGIGGPSFELIRELRQAHPGVIEVVVDAAQMRITNYSLHQFLREGFMVILSASKFFTGPPFAGALIVPEPLAGKVEKMAPLPNGMRAYNTRYEFPRRWRNLTANLSAAINFGVLLRWRAALWEMKSFYAVSPKDKVDTIANFGDEITCMINDNPDLALVMAPPPNRNYPDGGVYWDQLPSIFTFVVYHIHADGRRPLSYDDARIAYRFVNMDATHLLPIQASDREYELMRKRCHIGQPVRIPDESGAWIGGLRIAAGARLVSGVQFDQALGASPAERLGTEIRTAGVIFSKLSVILKYWDVLTSYKSTDTLGAVAPANQF